MGRSKKKQESGQSNTPPAGGKKSRRWRWICLLFLLAFGGVIFADWWIGLPAGSERKFVGRNTCAECHQGHVEKFTGSHHDLAMDRATPQTVLANFDNATLEHHGLTSRMFRRDEKFFINTEGPDGKLADFEIKYVFGVEPLQQYLVEFDRADDLPENEVSRLQVLRVSWDTQKQRWFHLNPPDVAERLLPNDDLHWTGSRMRWNNTCADCHSTNLQKGFDVESLRYHTTFSEIDVSCEACHGPGSSHVQLAREIKGYRSLFWDRREGKAIASLKGPNDVRSEDRSHAEIETCAACHSRRHVIQGGFQAGCSFDDYFSAEKLISPLYHADGQILDEVFEHGSFCQSKMFHKGIKCTDCHDAHSAKLKFEGNKLCTSCHAHPAGRFDTPAHHGHKTESKGSQCVECHMPSRTYMDVHSRRDHSLRIPRPDLSISLGTPNACTSCHIADTKLPPEARPKSPTPNREVEYADWLAVAAGGNVVVQEELKRLDAWADKQLDKQFTSARKKPPHFAEGLTAARLQAPDAKEKLLIVVKDRTMPAIARATAILELGGYIDPLAETPDEVAIAVQKGLSDKQPIVRAAAAISLRSLSNRLLPSVLAPIMEDSSRLVRTEAARGLARIPIDSLRGKEPIIRERVLDELLKGTAYDDDRAEGHLLAGVVLEELGEDVRAKQWYEMALRVEPRSRGARANLASLLERMGAEVRREAEMAARNGDAAGAKESFGALGPLEAEVLRLRAEELDLVERDLLLLPQDSGLQRQTGFARLLGGWQKEAETALRMAFWLDPTSPQAGYSWAILLKDTGRLEEAAVVAKELVRLRPKEQAFLILEKELLQVVAPQPLPDPNSPSEK